MKTLFLMRHAKSSWNNANLADFDRPLNPRGERTAPFMGNFMRDQGFDPSIIISSPAARAEQTTRLAVEMAKFNCEVRTDERIYEASARTLLQVIAEIGNAFETALLVGHNPGMEDLIRLLTGEIEPMPTAALAAIDLDIADWNEAADGCGRLRGVFRPKELTSA